MCLLYHFVYLSGLQTAQIQLEFSLHSTPIHLYCQYDSQFSLLYHFSDVRRPPAAEFSFLSVSVSAKS